MPTPQKALPLILLALCAVFAGPLAAQAQNDCTSSTFTFTVDAVQTGVPNLSQNSPCVNWRITFSTTGTLTSTVTFQTSPDNSTWTSVPNIACSGALTPCVIQGTNPTTGAQGMMYVNAYGAFVRVITTGSAGAGKGTIRYYGAKGATANAPPASGATLAFVTADPTGACIVGQPNVQNSVTGSQFVCTGPVVGGPGVWQLILAADQGGNLIYFLTPTASSIATYLLADSTLPMAKTTLSFPTLATGTDTLQNWATAVGQPGLTSIPQGTFTLHLHALRTGGGTVNLFQQLWEVNSAGVDIAMIGQSEQTGALGTVETQFNVEFVTGAPYILATANSRIVSRLFAVVSGSLPTVQVFVGDGSDSHIALPSNAVNTTNFVPYNGAVQDVNLGPHNLSLLGSETVGTTSTLGAALTVLDTRSTVPRGIMDWQTSTDNASARYTFAKTRGTATSPTTIVSGDILGRQMFNGFDGTNYIESAAIEGSSIGTILATRVPSFLRFQTSTDTTPSVLTEWMRLDQAGLMTHTLNGIGTTPTDSVLLTNTTPAANGAQQNSPALHWKGNGWGTTAGTSQSVDFRLSVVPSQGAIASGILNLDASLNGAAYTTGIIKISPFGDLTAAGSLTGQRFVATSSASAGNSLYLPAANTLGFTANSVDIARINSTGLLFTAVSNGLTFKSGANGRTGTGALVGGTLAVANTSITANSQVFIQDTGGGVIANIGSLYVASQTVGVGFTVTSSNVLDTSTFRYWIFETN